MDAMSPMKKYSISLARCDGENVDIAAFCNIFDSIEIGGGIFAAQSGALPKNGQICSVTDLFDSSLLNQLLDQNRTIVRDFKSQLTKVLARLHALKISNAALSFPVARILNDVHYAGQLQKLLHECSGAFYEYELNLSMSLRVPSAYCSVDNFRKLLDFRRQSMCRYLGFELDIFVHETLSGTDIAGLLDALRFDLNAVRFVYEANAGNKLVESNIAPWLEILEKYHYDKHIFCCPVCSDMASALEEAVSFEQLVKNLSFFLVKQ